MANKFEMYLGGSWTDVTSYVRQDPGADITFGVQNEGSTADANTCTIVVNNTDGRFTPRNTAGAYYGNLKRNTPLRVTVGTTVRFVGEIAEFPPRWIENENVAWVPLTASGILRRLQHAKSLDATVTSAIRTLSKTNADITGYWPCEDAQGATTIAPGLAGGTPGTFTGSPVFDSVDLGVGTHNVPTWGGATATFYPTTVPSVTEFTAGFYCQLPTTGLTGGEELFRCDVDGTSAVSWRVIYSPGTAGALFLQVIHFDGVTELLATGNIDNLGGETFYVKIECTQNGANVDYAFGTLGVGTTLTGSIASRSIKAPMQAAIGSGTIAIPADAAVAIGHVVLGSTDTALAHPTFDNGRAGDRKSTRLNSSHIQKSRMPSSA